MPVNEYPYNQTVRLSALFTVDEIPTDPSQVILFIQRPDDTESTYYYSSGSVSRLSTGSYYYDLLPNDTGIWYYRWEGEGVVAADEHQFIVKRSEFYGSHFAT